MKTELMEAVSSQRGKVLLAAAVMASASGAYAACVYTELAICFVGSGWCCDNGYICGHSGGTANWGVCC